ncbi:MAG: dTMP kinase, partial [Candidatus Kryptoniota bacterium]
QAELLSRRLTEEDIPNEILREPGGTALGEGVRDLLLHRADLKIEPLAEFLLFSASRAQLVNEQIIPTLAAGKVVILDRYFYSSIAYQGFGRAIPVEQIEMISRLATKDIVPDVIFLVELDVKTALKRRLLAHRSVDRMEDSEIKFFEKVIEGFDYCAKNEPDRFVLVNGNSSIDDMSGKILLEVKRRIRNLAEERNAS